MSFASTLGPAIDMLGMLLVIFTNAPVTGFAAESLSVTTIASLPCFGGLGENAVLIAISDDAPPPQAARTINVGIARRYFNEVPFVVLVMVKLFSRTCRRPRDRDRQQHR